MGINAKPLPKRSRKEGIKPKRTDQKTKMNLKERWEKDIKDAEAKKDLHAEAKRLRAEEAAQHSAKMAHQYEKEIHACAEQSEIYESYIKDFAVAAPHGDLTVSVNDTDSVSAVLEESGKKQCILNFASYKNPGGGFITGSIAQEEALCHESFLYNVLSMFQESFYEQNKKYPNWSLYGNRSVYSPDVIFIRGEQIGKADIITCASPNWRSAKSYGVTEEENERILRQRINHLLKVAAVHKIERLILGAFGCGAFGQDPSLCARIFHEEIERVFHGRSMDILFAIPMGNGNFEIFRDEMEKSIDWKSIPAVDWTPVKKRSKKTS